MAQMAFLTIGTISEKKGEYFQFGLVVELVLWFGRLSAVLVKVLRFCKPKIKSVDYQNVMKEHLLPLWLHSDQTHAIYQQDNAPIHKSS